MFLSTIEKTNSYCSNAEAKLTPSNKLFLGQDVVGEETPEYNVVFGVAECIGFFSFCDESTSVIAVTPLDNVSKTGKGGDFVQSPICQLTLGKIEGFYEAQFLIWQQGYRWTGFPEGSGSKGFGIIKYQNKKELTDEDSE